jgi:hypothetical protein
MANAKEGKRQTRVERMELEAKTGFRSIRRPITAWFGSLTPLVLPKVSHMCH